MVYVAGVRVLVYVVRCRRSYLVSVGGVGAVVYWCGGVVAVWVRGRGVLVYASGAGAVLYAGMQGLRDVLVRCVCCGIPAWGRYFGIWEEYREPPWNLDAIYQYCGQVQH